MSVLGRRLADRRVIVCAGSGGVGKTTLAAAIGLGLAAQGRRVAVVTIDPARRLGEALGLERLGNEPQRVDAAHLDADVVEIRGELWAMMLDAKRTFDELIARLAPDERMREEILGNAIYRQLSTAVAGSQEFTAIAKLHELDRDGGFDAIVLDTPPSRNALDFLDAPDRLVAFFEGRALTALTAPSGLTRALGGGLSAALVLLRRLTGVDLLESLGAFLRAIGGLADDFRGEAADVRALLSAPTTTFLVIAAPERASVDEAIFFTRRLREAELPFGGAIVNRVLPVDPGELGAVATAARLEPALGAPLARRVAGTHAEVQVLARRHAANVERLRRELGAPEPLLVPYLAGDVHDLGGLAALCAQLFGDAPGRAPTR